MYTLESEIIQIRNNNYIRNYGMTYEEFEQLDYDEQQALIKEYWENQKVNCNRTVPIRKRSLTDNK